MNRKKELEKELEKALSQYRSIRLTADDYSDISDRYQEKLELSWYIKELRDEIAMCK